MNQQSMPALSLFDLLARNWKRPSPIRQVCFNADDTLLAIVSSDGAVAFARMADNEPPEARISSEGGQTMIKPRQGKPAPLIITRITGAISAHAVDGGGFLAAGEGDVAHLSRSGETVGKVISDVGRLSTFGCCKATAAMAVSSADELVLYRDVGGASTLRRAHAGGELPSRLSFSGDGSLLAAASSQSLVVYRCREELVPLLQVPLQSQPLSLAWDQDGRWLALGVEGGALCLVDVNAGRHVLLGDFPGHVADVAWCEQEEAFVASGAYRIAAWSMKTPPFDDRSTGALATGRTGLALVEAVSPQPGGRLVAAGYGNGQVAVSPLGAPDELIVRSLGGPVTSLQWTADGKHLAFGDALGNVAVVSFPAQMFK